MEFQLVELLRKCKDKIGALAVLSAMNGKKEYSDECLIFMQEIDRTLAAFDESLPKPTEGQKYPIGQRFIITDNIDSHGFELGETVILDRYDESGDMICRGVNGGDWWWVGIDEMEPIN